MFFKLIRNSNKPGQLRLYALQHKVGTKSIGELRGKTFDLGWSVRRICFLALESSCFAFFNLGNCIREKARFLGSNLCIRQPLGCISARSIFGLKRSNQPIKKLPEIRLIHLEIYITQL